jgi:serine/threonine protein kinase
MLSVELVDRIGRYKIVRELGRGSMGVVYHALDPNIGRPVAIKTLRIADVRKPEDQQRLRERLLREARSAGLLSHPGIVTIYDVEQQGDLAYIAMEYVDGPTLDQILSQGAPLAPNRIFSILGQTAAALDYAHQKGIVHRDIKPANIMIAADGTAKITDFGIAKITTTDQFTMTGTIVGTPHYMSPEQVQGQAVDGRSDQFSLAVIVYEILTGEKPYTGEHLTTVVYKIVAEEPAPAHRLNPSLGTVIEAVLRKGLAKKPDGRYRTCSEFTEALERACAATRGWKPLTRGGSLSAPTVAEGLPAVKLPPARNPRHDATLEPPPKKSGFIPWLVAIAIVTGLLALMSQLNGPLKPRPQAAAVTPPKEPARSPAPAQFPKTPVPDAVPAAGLPNLVPAVPKHVDDKPSPMPPPEPASESRAAGLNNGPARPGPVPSVTPAARITTDRPGDELGNRAPETPRRVGSRTAPASQPVTVVSSPAGATATLDGQADVSCTTPCSLDSPPGRHTIAVTLSGYEIEHREVDIGSSPYELPPVVLRPPGSTLYLRSAPSGASISINGRKLSEVTPARIPLPPGTYNVTVEKNGKQSTQSVEVQNGKLNLLTIPLE